MQRKENKSTWLETEINKRETYITTSLSILIQKLSRTDPSIEAPIYELFIKIHRDEDLKNKYMEQIKTGFSERGETLVVWVNIALALSYLKSVNNNNYLNQLTLVTVQLGKELCIALDEVTKLVTNIDFESHFNNAKTT